MHFLFFHTFRKIANYFFKREEIQLFNIEYLNRTFSRLKQQIDGEDQSNKNT